MDDDVHDVLVRGLPKGVKLTGIMDCCHSESIFDLPYVYTVNGDLQIIETSKNEGLSRSSQREHDFYLMEIRREQLPV